MVSNVEAEIQWTFAIALAVATVVAVSYGGGITPKQCRWFFGLKRRFCLPMMLISIVLAAVFTVSAVGIFLFFRDRQDFRNDYYDATLGLHVGVLGALYFFGKIFFLWRIFWSSMLFSLLAFAASLTALVLLGIEGNRTNKWAPFGLYFALPVFLLYLCCQIGFVWFLNKPPLKSAMRKKKYVTESYSSSSSHSDSGYEHESSYYSAHHGPSAVVIDEDSSEINF